MAQVLNIDADFPMKLQFLFRPKRYKIAHGGRGGAKSWGFARALLLKGLKQPLRILCAREFQNSIKDSVHKLLDIQISKLGLDAFYTVQQTSIKGKNGTEFFFIGLRHNPSGIKSYEDVDLVWIEEAHNVSKTSWDILIPTIRKENSEIWVSFNPELEDDETYQRFVIDPPANADVVKVGWQDNPWFPKVLDEERRALKAKNEDDYLHVWEGHCREILEGAIYADELRKAKEENRITNVPYDATKPVNTYWDLGWADNTSIWFVQSIGKEMRIIDFYQNARKSLQHYISVLQNKGYVYGEDFLPHDAQAGQLAAAGKSIEEQLRSMGRKVRIVPRDTLVNGIQATRMVFGQCWFDAGRCADGLQALRHYRYDQDANTGKFSEKPLHDENSHAADAFRMFALGHVPQVIQESIGRGVRVKYHVPDPLGREKSYA